MQDRGQPVLGTRREAGFWTAMRSHAVYLFMLLWSLLGLFVTDFQPRLSVLFWEATTLLFAGIAIWRVVRRGGRGTRALALKQVAHWGAFLAAMFLLHTKQVAQVLTQDALGLVMLLLLAVATFLDGLYVDWRFCLVGGLLASGVILLPALANALPLILLVAALVIAALYLLRDRADAASDRSDAA